jgi:hypothetical protein
MFMFMFMFMSCHLGSCIVLQPRTLGGSREYALRTSRLIGLFCEMPSNMEVRRAVEEEVESQIQTVDHEQRLSYKDYWDIKRITADDAFNRLLEDMRPELGDDDRAFIQSTVERHVREYLSKPLKARYHRFERVVCKIGGERKWAPGTIQSLDEDDPSDPTGQTKLPYVVKIDPPIGRLISVPYDENSICRAEVCFGQRDKHDLEFALRCKPRKKEPQVRFGVGDRVACAVEDASGDYTIWSAGTVADVDYDVEPDANELGLCWDWTGMAGILPYRVLLDSAVASDSPVHVYVHCDVHCESCREAS